MDFGVTVTRNGTGSQSVAVVSAVGDIDIQWAPELTSALDEAIDGGSELVVVDLAEVSFLDSSALGALVGASKRALAADGMVVVVAAQERVLKLFRITRLTELFPIYSSIDDALRSRESCG